MFAQQNRNTMRAVCLSQASQVELTAVPIPKPEPNHVLIKVSACAVNQGDKAWVSGTIPRRLFPESLYDVCGVSGVGTVLAVGENVTQKYLGKKVAFYRSLQASNQIVGAWSEYARMHYLHCIVLPDEARDENYSGSLVNIITAYSFLERVLGEGHRGIICTAGTSATGRALLGLCLEREVPMISLVRNETEEQELQKLGALHILVQSDPDFDSRLTQLARELRVTAVLDGVGGKLIGRVARGLPFSSSTIYAYGFLGGNYPPDFQTGLLLMKGLTLTWFGVLSIPTVREPTRLKQALRNLAGIVEMPHFWTKVGKTFKLEDAVAAMTFTSDSGGKAVLRPLA